MSKPTLKTRAYQEACVFSVIEELAEHLAQWSYSVAFFELSFVPAVRLRNFCKSTKIERFRKEIRQLLCQVNPLEQLSVLVYAYLSETFNWKCIRVWR